MNEMDKLQEQLEYYKQQLEGFKKIQKQVQSELNVDYSDAISKLEELINEFEVLINNEKEEK